MATRTPATAAHRFEGRIAGFGTSSGTRVVLGLWERSPLGRFADAMVEDDRGHRILIAPDDAAAEFIAATYRFDEVRVEPVRARRIEGGIAVGGGALEARLRVGGLTSLGRMLRAVPAPIATAPAWLIAIDPLATRLVAGVRTAGTAGGGRREYYGVTAVREIVWAEASLDGQDLGAFGPLDPPVRFGFGSAPADPSIVDVVTTIR
jgi:hypothetical protein